jgi:hypothetical protein
MQTSSSLYRSQGLAGPAARAGHAPSSSNGSLVWKPKQLHADPRLTANVYTRVDLADLRAGVARLPPLVPTVSPRADFTKNEGREQSGNPTNLAALHWSGRQDLNLRPPGPERAQEESHGVSEGGIESQPGETIQEQ